MDRNSRCSLLSILFSFRKTAAKIQYEFGLFIESKKLFFVMTKRTEIDKIIVKKYKNKIIFLKTNKKNNN